MPSAATLLAIPALLILCFISYNTMHLQPQRNQYALVIQELVKDPAPRFLPGTDRLILRRYTGIEKIDEILTLLNIVFANTADWTRPELSLYCFQFSGQAIPLFLVFYTEALRVGARWTLIQGPCVLLWGMGSQLLGYQVALPIFAIIHLFCVAGRPNKMDAVRITDPVKVQALIPGFFFGFILPTALIGFPFESSSHRQIANAIWQTFPVLVYAFSSVFASVWKRSSIGADMHKSQALRERTALSSVYTAALFIAGLTHWITVIVIVSAQLAPGVFPPGFAEHFTWSKVFLPTTFISSAKYESVGQAVHDMFRWDQILGAIAAFVWAVAFCFETGGIDIDLQTLNGILKDTVSVGPGGALVNLLKTRDDVILKTVDEKKAQ